jgi:hypothetical protein
MQKIKVRVKKVESKPLSKGDKALVAMAEAGGEYGKGRLKDVAENIKNKMKKKVMYKSPTMNTKSGTYEPTSTNSRVKKTK